MAIEFENPQTCAKIVQGCLKEGVLTDWFLFAPQCLRLAPPLTITGKEIRKACKIILGQLEQLSGDAAPRTR